MNIVPFDIKSRDWNSTLEGYEIIFINEVKDRSYTCHGTLGELISSSENTPTKLKIKHCLRLPVILDVKKTIAMGSLEGSSHIEDLVNFLRNFQGYRHDIKEYKLNETSELYFIIEKESFSN